MKHIFLLTVLFTASFPVHAQSIDLSGKIVDFGQIVALINESGVSSGTITFEKSTSGSRSAITTYRYEDGLTSMWVESIMDTYGRIETFEIFSFETRSPDFPLFGFRVGMSADELAEKAGGPPAETTHEADGSTKLMYYITRESYLLYFIIRDNMVSRIYIFALP